MQNKESNNFLNGLLFPFISFISFGIIFLIYFILIQNNIINGMQLEQRLIDYKNYYQYVGFAFGFIAMLIIYLLYIIKKIIFLGKFKSLDNLVFIFSYGCILAFALDLLYIEKRFHWINIFLIDGFGKPLLYTSSVFVFFGIIWFFISLFKNNN